METVRLDFDSLFFGQAFVLLPVLAGGVVFLFQLGPPFWFVVDQVTHDFLAAFFLFFAAFGALV